MSRFVSLHHRNGGDKGNDGIEGDSDKDTENFIKRQSRLHYTGQAELLRSLKCQIPGYNFVSLSCKDKKGKPIAVLD